MRLDILKNAVEKLSEIAEKDNYKTGDIDIQMKNDELNVTLPGKVHKINVEFSFSSEKDDEEIKILEELNK